jgi:hypothetical protein
VDGEKHGTGSSDSRDVNEFMGELRVALPGAQVLFAFLLTVPFSSRFASLPDKDRGVYFLALLSAAVASVLLITPSALAQFLRGQGRPVVRPAVTVVALSGLGFLGVALAAALYLVADILYGEVLAAIVAVAAVVVVGTLWYLFPRHVTHQER